MLSMKAKYALKALLILVNSPEKRMQSRKIAANGQLPEKFLETILQQLREAGIVNSKRGIMGGYELAHAPSDISVGDIIRHIDGYIAPLQCASVQAYKPCEDCIDPQGCAIRKIMNTVRDAMSSVLDTCSLQDFAGLDYKADYVI